MKLARSKKLKAKVEEQPEDIVTSDNKYTDLHQVMDYTRPFTIFFSGVEYESYLDILYELGVRNFLMSYEYLKGKGSFVLRKYHDVHIFIDSGAFTYQSDPKYADYTVEQWESQIEEYLRWVEKHKNSIFAFADLDLQYLPKVGYQKVYEWRKKYFEPFMLRTGIPCCFIYHDDGLDYWDYMCKRYPYVGMSTHIDNQNSDEVIKEMMRIAEKHNSLIQGMATTDTRILTELPFYTVDSTTWNVGLKYGEISVWDKTRMRRIKKEDFDTKAFPIISQYDTHFDFDLIKEEDKTEMVRVNAYAFVTAEKYVRDRLKARMYWLKAKANRNNIEDMSIYPTPEAIDSGCSLADYAEKMNINPEAPEVDDLVMVATILLNRFNPDYEEQYATLMTEEVFPAVTELHDKFINRIVGDDETRVSDLVSFFSSCITGECDVLLQLGTNFDRVLKERDSYIEDEVEYDTVELTKEEVRARLSACLPSPEDGVSPEIDGLDDEIFRKEEIVPVRSTDGKLLKGQTKVRKPRQVYSQKYPKFACDTCYAAQRCKEFKAGCVCAFQKMFERFDTRNQSDVVNSIQGIVNYNMVRMQRAMIMETMNGTIDANVSQLMDTNVRYMNMLNQMYQNGSMEIIRQSRIMRADGSMEETTQVSNPQSGGIMERLFSSIMNKSNRDLSDGEEDIIEAQVVQEDTAKNERYTKVEEEFT